MKEVGDNCTVEFRGIRFQTGRPFAAQTVCIMDAGATMMIFDLHGTLIIVRPWPQLRLRYVGTVLPRGPRRTLNPSPMS